MQESYIFREIKKDEVDIMFSLILARVKWMDEVGIKQWNTTKYDEVYPLSYYEEKRQNKEAFVLIKQSTNEIVCVGVLKQEDDRWNDPAPALYLHNFATKIGERGVGKIFISLSEKLAKEMGKEFFRLDSAVGNEKLEEYYNALGFSPVGECVDGEYAGILREKRI